MPRVLHEDVLAATYTAIRKQIAARNFPTLPLARDHTVFRAVDQFRLPKPAAGGHLTKTKAEGVLIPRDGTEKYNRFSGPSYSDRIPTTSGLYCVLQPQALMNEVMFYAKKAGLEKATVPGMSFSDAVLRSKCVVKIMLTMRLNVGELSEHNVGLRSFVSAVENSAGYLDLLKNTYGPKAGYWECLTDSDDCSVARGTGLAVAHSKYMDGLSVQTVRSSDRSPEEKGDNLVLFGSSTRPVHGLRVVSASYFQTRGKVETFPCIWERWG